jgi:hypothetical protein
VLPLALLLLGGFVGSFMTDAALLGPLLLPPYTLLPLMPSRTGTARHMVWRPPATHKGDAHAAAAEGGGATAGQAFLWAEGSVWPVLGGGGCQAFRDRREVAKLVSLLPIWTGTARHMV